MGSFNDVVSGSSADSSCVQQIIDVLKGTAGNAGNIPISVTAINDAANFALSVKNLDPTNTRSFRALDSSGGALIQADINGVSLKTITVSSGATINGTMSGTAGFNAWSTLATPVFNQGGAVAATVSYATYTQVGKTVHAQISLTPTAGGAGGSAIVISGLQTLLPVPKHLNGAIAVCGHALYFDASATNYYTMTAEWNTADVLAFHTNGSSALFGVSPAVTAASSDALVLQVTYETT